MRMKKPTKPRVPTFYNYYISEESKKLGGSIEEAAKKYSQLSESEKLALKEAYSKNPTLEQKPQSTEKELVSPFNTYTEKLKKLADEMYTEANCHVISYVTQRHQPGTSFSACRSCTVHGTEVARNFANVDLGYMGLGTQHEFSCFVMRNDNGGRVCPINAPTLKRTKAPGVPSDSVKSPQILQAKERAEFVKLILNTFSKWDFCTCFTLWFIKLLKRVEKGGDTDRIKNMRMVPWKKLKQTRRSNGLRLIGWPDSIPISSAISREDQVEIASLIERGKLMFI
ncbi:unnamed protein product [Mucor hiemalis]